MTSDPTDEPEPQSSRPGFEEIPLDLTAIGTVDEGLAQADERYKAFAQRATAAIGFGANAPLFREHMTLMSLVARASSLHKGIVCAVREANPHSALTLLRAYLELVVTGLYLDAHPSYIEALERPMSELPRGARKRFSELFEFAAGEMPGVRTVYSLLNEMAHFGSTALWQPFSIEEGDDGRRLSFYSGPHWRGQDDYKTVLAMLRENDDAMAEIVRLYAAHHVAPLVERHAERERIQTAFAAAGARPFEDEEQTGIGIVPPALAESAQGAGLLEWCEEHGALELVAGTTAAEVEAWAAGLGETMP